MELSAKEEKQNRFLLAYLETCGNRTEAAKIAGVPLPTMYRWFREPEFCERLTKTFQRFEQPLLEEAIKRALAKSDLLLMFLLKSINPERYDEGVRKQKLANRMDDQDKPLSEAQLRDLVENDPAQEFTQDDLKRWLGKGVQQ